MKSLRNTDGINQSKPHPAAFLWLVHQTVAEYLLTSGGVVSNEAQRPKLYNILSWRKQIKSDRMLLRCREW